MEWLFAVRKGLEPALRAETLSTLPPAASSSCPLRGLEVEGSANDLPKLKQVPAKRQKLVLSGAEGTRTLDLRRDRPAF